LLCRRKSLGDDAEAGVYSFTIHFWDLSLTLFFRRQEAKTRRGRRRWRSVVVTWPIFFLCAINWCSLPSTEEEEDDGEEEDEGEEEEDDEDDDEDDDKPRKSRRKDDDDDDEDEDEEEEVSPFLSTVRFESFL
jgi:hypothetical protein